MTRFWFYLVSILLSLSKSIEGSRKVNEHAQIKSPTCLFSKDGQLDFRWIRAISIRGGDEEEEGDALESTVDGLTIPRVFSVLGKATLATFSALKRAILAAFESTEVESNNDQNSSVTKLFRMLRRMWRAAIEIPAGDDTQEEEFVSKPPKKKSKSVLQTDDSGPISDFGQYLSKNYGVSRNHGSSPILGGTIGDALRDARSKARLLLVFIPASNASNRKKMTSDQMAIESLLSQDVTQAANKPAKKKTTTGSFLLWGAKASSPEAVIAIKRLKVRQPKGEKRPILVVAYPAQVLDSLGHSKLVPRLLAQHHCSPPPTPESMAAWLNALRKRHASQFASMQHELKEVQMFKERQQGYRGSVQDDLKRQEQEQRAEEERLAKAAAEQTRQDGLTQRREELAASLPDEPPKETSFTIALRFPNGNAGQRRFEPATPLVTVFNWVDAMYGMERELVVLTTMNGQKAFTWDDIGRLTLQDAGLGRMTGLRVSEKVEKEEVNESAL